MNLIQQLEAAERGSRELDWRIAELFDVPEPWPKSRVWPPFNEGSKFELRIPHYTTSLDAARALTKRLLPGWEWEVAESETEAWAYVCPSRLHPGTSARTLTVPLALVIATLKALEAGA